MMKLRNNVIWGNIWAPKGILKPNLDRNQLLLFMLAILVILTIRTSFFLSRLSLHFISSSPSILLLPLIQLRILDSDAFTVKLFFGDYHERMDGWISLKFCGKMGN